MVGDWQEEELTGTQMKKEEREHLEGIEQVRRKTIRRKKSSENKEKLTDWKERKGYEQEKKNEKNTMKYLSKNRR